MRWIPSRVRVEIMDKQDTIVYKDPGAYSCFPDVVLRRNGELLVTFRRAGGFSLEALRRGKYDHVDKGARIALARSVDGGRSWTLDRIFEPFAYFSTFIKIKDGSIHGLHLILTAGFDHAIYLMSFVFTDKRLYGDG